MHPLRGFTAILNKEILTIARDRASLFFMFFPAVVQIIAYGYALDMDVKHMPMVVLNEDRTAESFAMVDRMVNTESFRLAGEVSGVEELAATIRSGRASCGLQIPPGFARELRAGRTARVQAVVDGSNSTPALKALQTALSVGMADSLRILSDAAGRPLPVEVRPQVLYNPGMLSPNFYLPGMIGLALQLAALFATSLSIVREKESGTLENLVVSRPSRWGLMLGKLVPYLVITMVMAGGLFLILRWLFLIPVAGPVWALFASSLVYVFTILSLGLLLSTIARTHMHALQMTLAMVLPSVFFSGFIFPRESMPAVFWWFGALLPSTYFIDLMRAIILRGATPAELLPAMAVLCLMGAVLFVGCAMRFRKHIE